MDSENEKIAVIGMACRFPGANNISEFWNNLINGRDTIKHFTDDELSRFEINYADLKTNPNYVRARGILNDIDKFDARFFGMTPEEASLTDPQHRVWLENAWQAFENAGCDPINYDGNIGVFAGGFVNTYLLNNILRDQAKLENYIRLRYPESYQIMIGNDNAYIPTKTAYHFNLKGPAINVQTACSTSLVAISQACQSLFSFESDICLAGGVCIIVPQESGYVYQQGTIPSPDGCCRPFDIKGQGTVFSNGVGAVVLKRLDDALRDRDMIYALVSGWALNNDGNNKVSYMAPSVDGQANVVMMAQAFAGISPEQIAYIEAHGTATQLGDPLEITALKKAFSGKTDKKQFCGIGSVKGNIGHTDAAAGVASFIKTSLAAYYRKIPPSIHFSSPNKYIKFESTPFYVLHELKEWTEDRPLIMGVSSFGIGGTNAHMIIEEPPRRKKSINITRELPELLLLSAKSKESLKKRKEDLIEYINKNKEKDLSDISFSLASGRHFMPFRSYMTASDLSEIQSINNFSDCIKDDQISKIVFMFPGEGTQYPSMGKDLYESNVFFRQILDECFEFIKSEISEDFYKILNGSKNLNDGIDKLANPEITETAIFIIEYALAKLLEKNNVIPDIIIGYGIGEYAAACLAGVIDLQSALKIIIKRRQLLQGIPEVCHMSVKAGVNRLQELNNSLFEFASDDSPVSCSITFRGEDLLIIKELLDTNGIEYNESTYSSTFNSRSIYEILPEFREYLSKFYMTSPRIPLISCRTSKLMVDGDSKPIEYFETQLLNKIRFREAVAFIAKNDDALFLEVGPYTHLSSLVEESNIVKNKDAIISTLGNPDGVDEKYKIVDALGKMYNIGLELDYHRQLHNKLSVKINLPDYPFEKKSYWNNYEPIKSSGKVE